MRLTCVSDSRSVASARKPAHWTPCSTTTAATGRSRPATAASTGGSSPPCGRPASTAGRAARRRPQAPQRRVLPDRRRRPAARLPGVQALPARRLARLARVGRARRRRRPGDAARSPTASSTARASRGLARRLAYSERHLNRAWSPTSSAPGRSPSPEPSGPRPRAHADRDDRHARSPTSPSPPGSAACASSTTPSASVFATTPRELRGRGGAAGGRPTAGAVELDLAGARAVRRRARARRSSPARAVPGVEHWDGATYHRALDLPGGHGTVGVGGDRRRDGRPAVRAALRLADWRDLRAGRPPGPAAARPRRRPRRRRRRARATTRCSAPWVAATPGLRVPGSVDPFETARARRSSASRSPSPARAPSPAASSPPSATPLTIDDDRADARVPDARALARRDRPGRCCRCRTRRRRTIVELAARVADRRARARRRRRPRRRARRRCSTCRASGRGRPATC